MPIIWQGVLVPLVGLVLIGLRVPIGLALATVAFAGLANVIGFDASISLVGRIPYEFAANWEFSAIPMFILMGSIAYHTGMTNSIYRAASLWLGSLPGGLAVATNMACAGFGAASGSTIATAVALGKIAIPEMLKYGYQPGLATAVSAAGGTLAGIIPPSIALIVYGITAEVSVAKLFIAGIIPGLLTAVIYAAMIIIRCSADPTLAPKPATVPSREEKRAALKEIWPLGLIIAIVIGGIYGGIFSPTEAGAVGALASIIIALLKRSLSLAIVRTSLRDAMVTTAQILFVAMGALMLSRYMALVGLPEFLQGLVTSISVSPLLLILTTSVVYLILGMFLDPMSILLITVPIFAPMYVGYGYDPIWFGIIVVKFIEIGLLTPPVGLNVFAVATLVQGKIGLDVIFRGVMWFLLAEAVVMTILFTFPKLVTWLPSLI